MPSTRRIAILATWLQAGTTALLIGLPVGLLALMAPPLANPDWLLSTLTDLPPGTAMTPVKHAAMIGILWLALLPMIGALVHMRHLFRLYRRGDILTDGCARHILRIGQWLVALSGASVLSRPLHTLVMTHDNPPGQRVLAIGLDSAMLGFVMAGGLLVAIGWVMREAAGIARENAAFV